MCDAALHNRHDASSSKEIWQAEGQGDRRQSLSHCTNQGLRGHRAGLRQGKRPNCYTSPESASLTFGFSQIIEDAQTLQRAWYDYSVFQTAIVNGFQELYDPIVGTTDDNDGLRPMAKTPRHVMDRTNNLYDAYSSLQDELSVEITSIESQLLRPAIEAKDMISPFRVVIKKRDNKRVDYDCAHDKVMKLRRKPNKSPKEEAQLSKAEDDLANLTDVCVNTKYHSSSVATPLTDFHRSSRQQMCIYARPSLLSCAQPSVFSLHY